MIFKRLRPSLLANSNGSDTGGIIARFGEVLHRIWNWSFLVRGNDFKL